MTIGLLCLGVVALLIFFGVATNTLKEIGIPEWVAFVFVLALVIGVVIPSVQFGNVFLSISGFLIPMLICAMLFVAIGFKKDLFSVLIASLSIAAVTMLVKILFPISANAFLSVQSLVIGFASGILASVLAKKRTSALLSSIFGILLGDIAVGLINLFAYHNLYVGIGSDGIFDALVLSSIVGILIIGVAESMRVARVRRKYSPHAHNIEAASDIMLKEKKRKKNKKKRDEDTNINIIIDGKKETVESGEDVWIDAIEKEIKEVEYSDFYDDYENKL